MRGDKSSKSLAVTLIMTVVFSSLTLSATGVAHAQQPSGISDSSFTPTMLWNYTTGGTVGTYLMYNGWVYSPPAISNDTVYISSGDGLVYALNATTGTKIWSYGGSFPAIANGVVYVGGFENVYALNATNGSQLWDQIPIHGGGNSVDSSIVVENGVVYAPSDSGGLFALDATYGYQLWRFVVNDDNAIPVSSSPAIVNGVVYVSGGNTIYALNADNMAEVWSYITSGAGSFSAYPVSSSPVVDNGIVYLASGDGNTYALNATNGSRLWNYTYALSNTLVPSAPTVASGAVYIGSNNGTISALNATSGAKLWSSATGNGTLSTPSVVNGVVYMGSSDDNVYALNATTGARLGNYTISGSAFDYVHIGAGSPVVLNGVLYVGGGNSIYALNLSFTMPSSHIPFNMPVVIAVAAVIVIIVAAAFLVFRKRLKAKLSSPRPKDGDGEKT